MEALAGGLDVHCSLQTDFSFLYLNGAYRAGAHGTPESTGRCSENIWLCSRPSGAAEHGQKGGTAHASPSEVQSQGGRSVANVPAEPKGYLDEGACQVPKGFRKARARAAGGPTRPEQGLSCRSSSMDAEQRRTGFCHGSQHGGPVGEHATKLGKGRRCSIAVYFAASHRPHVVVCAPSWPTEAVEAGAPGVIEPTWCQPAMGRFDEASWSSSEPKYCKRPWTLWSSSQFWDYSSCLGRGKDGRVLCPSCCSSQNRGRDASISSAPRSAGTWDFESPDRCCATEKGHQVGYQRSSCIRPSARSWISREVGQEERADFGNSHASLRGGHTEGASATSSRCHHNGLGVGRRAGQCKPERHAVTRSGQNGIVREGFLGLAVEDVQCEVPGGHGHTEPDKPMGLFQARVAKQPSGFLCVACLSTCDTLELGQVSESSLGLGEALNTVVLRRVDCSSCVQAFGVPFFDSHNPTAANLPVFSGQCGIWTYWVCRFQCPFDFLSSAGFSSPLLGVLGVVGPASLQLSFV